MKITEILGISHLAFHFKDISKPYYFFSGVLNLKPKLGFSFEGQKVAILGAKGIDIELIEDPDSSENFESLHVAFKVKNIKKAVGQIRAGGFKIVRDIYCPTEGIKEAMIEGPCGLIVQFVEEDLKTLIWRSIKGEFKNMKDFPKRTPN